MPARKFTCLVCDHVYDEAQGDPQSGIAAGTRWEDVPADWVCPECGATKADFTESQCALS
jgi:rubredoxin